MREWVSVHRKALSGRQRRHDRGGCETAVKRRTRVETRPSPPLSLRWTKSNPLGAPAMLLDLPLELQYRMLDLARPPLVRLAADVRGGRGRPRPNGLRGPRLTA
jgi:hypothetical protein